MPVVDGHLEPGFPLVLAETVIDFPALNQHVLDQRSQVETSNMQLTRRVAYAAVTLDLPVQRPVDLLAHGLEQSLRRTVRFGHRTARQEITALRAGREVTGAYHVPDAGYYAQQALRGLEGILELVASRSRQAARDVADAALTAATAALADETLDDTSRLAIVVAAATRKLHNHVLELVGEALNLGRTAGAMTMRRPPEFAMRSEQLDKATCDACSRLHGEILEVGSSSYFSYLPPAGCFGGGRCRGIMVFADGPAELRGTDTEPGPQPELPAVPPVAFPERKVA